MRILIPALLGVTLACFAGPAVADAPPAAPAPPAAVGFGWPLDPPAVVRPFEEPESAFGPGHRGVDLAGRAGQPVLAAAEGVVVHAGLLVDRGVVSVEHPGGLRTSYEPITPLVARGDRVTRGQVIGHLEPGHPGCPAQACLHWGLREGGDYRDPLSLIGSQVRLLPW
ncbi:M23 family metallopeptidase [Saccharopolyspora rhizosphaerae]|uniref:M23 family metallopeptidase n=1 Tax=Saccharopolyspora rhizosphaerae TaxID=2492662 RepID=A0A3R8Q3N3_9PSEU|nr:M23 family metallopeptidase [Saccharopolyspora rhizosphaerae]RRO16211.1 M23 family metallopeptidase [Saccharopolyspora rhizosphaerae]